MFLLLLTGLKIQAQIGKKILKKKIEKNLFLYTEQKNDTLPLAYRVIIDDTSSNFSCFLLIEDKEIKKIYLQELEKNIGLNLDLIAKSIEILPKSKINYYYSFRQEQGSSILTINLSPSKTFKITIAGEYTSISILQQTKAELMQMDFFFDKYRFIEMKGQKISKK